MPQARHARGSRTRHPAAALSSVPAESSVPRRSEARGRRAPRGASSEVQHVPRRDNTSCPFQVAGGGGGIDRDGTITDRETDLDIV